MLPLELTDVIRDPTLERVCNQGRNARPSGSLVLPKRHRRVPGVTVPGRAVEPEPEYGSCRRRW